MAIDAKRAPDRGRDDQDAADRAVLGAKIRALRNDAGLTINALAAGAGVSSSLISQVERGVAEPSLSSLRRIANFLDAPVASLFVGNEDVPADSSNRRGERLVDRDEIRLGRSLEVEPVEGEDPPELPDRVGVVVHVEVDPAVVAAAVPATGADHQERRGLTSPSVAARAVGIGQAGDEQLRERPTAGLEPVRQRIDDRGPGEDVALGRIAVTGSAAGGRVERLRRVQGVADVSPDYPVSIGPPGSEVS